MKKRLLKKKIKNNPWMLDDAINDKVYDILYNHDRSEWYDLFKSITLKDEGNRIKIKCGKNNFQSGWVLFGLNELRENYKFGYNKGEFFRFKNNFKDSYYYIIDLPYLDSRVDFKNKLETDVKISNTDLFESVSPFWEHCSYPFYTGINSKGEIDYLGIYNASYYALESNIEVVNKSDIPEFYLDKFEEYKLLNIKKENLI